jgi:hypothetical protein
LKQCGQLATILVTPRLVQRLDVLPRVRLEDVLVAHPPRRVARARLARAEDRDVEPGRCRQLRRRLAPCAARSSNEAAQPTQ